MEKKDSVQENAPLRLCSEIQLFELCELDSCSYKTGRFCSDRNLLERFENIADISEAELRSPGRLNDEEPDDEELFGDDDEEFESQYEYEEDCDKEDEE